MTGDQPGDEARRYEELRSGIARNQAAIEALQGRVDEADARAEAGEVRARENHDRIGQLEERAEMDAILIAHLQAEGVVNQEHAANLEEGLRSARTIGTAIGIVMALRQVSDVDAFELLRKTSMDTNRKLRVVAQDVVLTGDVSILQPG